jgi:hypothetical protein
MAFFGARALFSMGTAAVVSFSAVVACRDGSSEIAADPWTAVTDGADATVNESDAGLDRDSAPPPEPCGPLEGVGRFTCTPDGHSREKCVDHFKVIEPCGRGCLREGVSADDVCMGTSTDWTCDGSFGTTKARDGDYFITAFGCWVHENGVEHGDPGDNCIPGCFPAVKDAGLCDAKSTGKACEEKLTWFVADAARFGCLAHVRVTNPANGKSVVAIAIDNGPACSVEAKAQKAVLDASGRVNRALFGSDNGVVDETLVHVVEVDSSLPLGPEN